MFTSSLNIATTVFNMSDRLIRLVNEAMVLKDLKELARSSGLTAETIRRIASGRVEPHRKSIHRLALACGCTEAEAMELALHDLQKTS